MKGIQSQVIGVCVCVRACLSLSLSLSLYTHTHTHTPACIHIYTYVGEGTFMGASGANNCGVRKRSKRDLRGM